MLEACRIDPPDSDPVSAVLKWVLLVVAIATFGLLAWATVMTYRAAPPQPERLVSASGAVGRVPGGGVGLSVAELTGRALTK
jgi:nitric oxide reductase subunit B